MEYDLTDHRKEREYDLRADQSQVGGDQAGAFLTWSRWSGARGHVGQDNRAREVVIPVTVRS
jgi:hypothetical protein